MDDRATLLTRIYCEQGPAVWRFAARRVGRTDEADEILQETFLIAAKNWDAVKNAESPNAWLIGIARNIIRQRTRRANQRRSMEFAGDLTARAAKENNPRIEDMKAAIAALPQLQRE